MFGNLQNKESVSISYNGVCLTANNQNARIIAIGLFAMFLLIGIAAFSKN
ncbi:MAG: hypothetical protein LBQ22_02975 [Bacteroidales bacterium]|jgi:riboflavin synthase alpha subunit|nr:hypothetical protein [Bacteroidales bacterium]